MKSLRFLAVPFVVLLAACGGGETKTPVATATATVAVANAATATTAPATVATTIAPPTTLDDAAILLAAQEAYLEIAGAYNAVLEDAYAPYTDSVPWADMPAICALLGPAGETFAGALRDYENWPTDAQDEIDAMIGASAAEAGLFYECADTAGTEAAMSGVWDRIDLISSEAGEAASAVRAVLALPLDR